MQYAGEWPIDCFRSTSENWHLAGSTPSTGGIFGPGTAIHFENRVWRATADLTALEPDQWRALRALFDRARGRFAVIRVPVIQAEPQAGAFRPRLFNTGRRLAQPDGRMARFAAETLEGVTVAADAPVGATMIAPSCAPALVALAAMFSLPGDRVYRVVGHTPTHLQIEPPLRVAAMGSQPMEFAAPWARMRLDIDDAHLARQPGRLTAPRSVPLVEALE